MANLVLAFFAVVASCSFSFVSGQNQNVTFCPLYLALQNRCPTTSTTTASPTTSSASGTTAASESNMTNMDGSTETSESAVTDACGLPTITFCPAMELFLSGGRTCNNGQTVQLSLTTLGQLLVNPSGQNAEAAVGAGNSDELGNAFTSVSDAIQATPTQGTIGVTFVPVGQLIG